MSIMDLIMKSYKVKIKQNGQIYIMRVNALSKTDATEKVFEYIYNPEKNVEVLKSGVSLISVEEEDV